ncbi:MAG: NAD+ synthase [Lautropia sp.]|nr:MAG: NAD+ synthase [Pseudomonadota bacterium]MBC6960072.1 NAD+ synthase [Lautropia sp.]MCL4702330.1 NAD+ synthase [Burkholderiaceae bacterium]MCZ2412854.1 NAD+ synthase [Burkholderiales bacterium]MDL1907589.1 NAD+ synthase [Betaproteobacteria bacterium PRO1]
MRIAAAQLNQVVGDFRGNVERIIAAAQEALARGVRVLLTPELSLSGYPPEDLLLREAFHAGCESALAALCEGTAALDIHLLVGHPQLRDGRRYNCASIVHRGRVVGRYGKHDLPNYDVFDEERYFEPENRPLVFEVDGVRFGVLICEDFWYGYAPECAQAAGAQAILVLNASPFHMDKQHVRIDVARENVSRLGLPMLAANLVGGQDELVFDGLSFALDAAGELRAQAPAFREDLLVVEVAGGQPLRFAPGAIQPTPPLEEQVYSALVLGVRDYVGKNGFPGAIIGLSGGVDSALVLAIAVDALGAARVRSVMMPSPYTTDMSLEDAREMARRVGVRYDEIPITGCFEAFLGALAGEFRGLSPDTTEENIQARIRGTLLMALSNKYGSIVLTTGNKSEMAVGYCTLYGDMAGGFAVIKDIAKTMVYRLVRWRNARGAIVPERIVTRAPSAELKPGQTDQDSLPPYETLDAIMKMYMEENRSAAQIAAAGHSRETVDRVVRLIQASEYKRRQAPVGIRVTHRAFGRDWRYPITSRFRE